MSDSDKRVLDTLISWGRYLNEYGEQLERAGISPGSVAHVAIATAIGNWLAQELPSSAEAFLDEIREESQGPHVDPDDPEQLLTCSCGRGMKLANMVKRRVGTELHCRWRCLSCGKDQLHTIKVGIHPAAR